MDTVQLFFILHSRMNIMNNSMGIWKPNKKENPTKYTAYYRGIYFTYKPEHFYVSINFSATKLLYGTNATTLDTKDVDQLLLVLNLYTQELLNNVPNIEEWEYNRLDPVTNYLCDNSQDVQTHLSGIKQLSFPRYISSGEYKNSLHTRNNSSGINIYNKHAQDSSADKRYLRTEFQLRNAYINRLIKKGILPNKKFGYLMRNLHLLNYIFIDRLNSLGLHYKYYTKSQMEAFLLKLLKKGRISNCIYKNMYSFFIEENKSISTNTLYKYKKLLAEYSVSHIIVDRQITRNIDFYKFNLYINKITKPENSFRIHTLLFLFVMHSIIITSISSIISISIILFKNNSLKIFFDDS